MAEPTHEELATMVRTAVSRGIKDALQDRAALDQFWNSAFAQLQGRATKETGRFVLSGLRGLVSKTLMFLVLGMAVYGLGGWAAVTKVWHAVWASQ
jgi:hypothetical protein